MNIFYLHHIPKVCAQYHCDKHVTKMLVEYGQMLSTAHRITNPDCSDNFYKIAHRNHPSCLWVRASKQNYVWMYKTFKHLHAEYQLRYGKTHLTFQKLNAYVSATPNIESNGFTAPPLCMDDEFKTSDPIQSYRNFYNGSKSRFATWKAPSITPKWFKG